MKLKIGDPPQRIRRREGETGDDFKRRRERTGAAA
jgi:hypothetical protein